MAGVTWVTKQMSATVGLSPSQKRPLVGCSASSVSIACRPAPSQCWIQASLSSAAFQYVREIMPDTWHDERARFGRVDQCNARTQALANGSDGNSGGSGYASSSYSRIASDLNSLMAPSIK